MIEHFVSNNRALKITLLELLCKQPLNLSNFSNEHNIQKYTIKRYLNELQIELEDYGINFAFFFPDSNTCVLNDGNNNSSVLTQELVENVKYNYLQSYSPAFLLCELLCAGERPTISRLEQHLRLSKSQIYKVITEFNESINSRTISISFNKNSILDFFGDELDVRIFIYNFIVTCTPKKNWFFKNTSKHQIYSDIMRFEELKNVSKYTLEKLCTFFGILQSRLLLKKYLSPILPRFQSTFARFSYLEFSTLNFYFSDKRLLDKNIQNTEYLYLNFFLRVFIPDAISEKNVLDIGRYLESSKNSDHLFLSSFLNEWELTFGITLSETKRPILLYNSAILATFAFFIPNNISQFWANNNNFFQEDIININLFEKVVYFVTNFINDYSLPSDKKIYLLKKGVKYFSSLYYLETFMFLNPKLNIYMYFTNDYTSKILLKSRIEQIYNTDIIRFVSQAEDSDVILTDSNEDYPHHCKVILVDSSLTTKKLTVVIETIHKQLLKQIFD
ncbi:m protein trans-acting positive regulator [Enterococcus sp. C1]|uniref:helix-turn-helix domain-containing protein n=1 Tax=Enterococcus sp. C1 TaxID=1182762 RepID=UPI0002721946|nr:helix-turn-helix domain-containing protein [Enterococcus sp. C1]EJF48058.1 m protein trans-acting positive regulator [Enterococcus sp. C1]